MINIGLNNTDLILINGELLFTYNNINELKNKVYAHFLKKNTLDVKEFNCRTVLHTLYDRRWVKR